MIRATRDGAILTVTIDRPEKANSLTAEMLSELIRVTAPQAGINALILTGKGKVFSAGADLDEAKAGLALSPLWETLSGQIANLPILTIAALNGTLAGGAFGMVLGCDLRIAVPGAKFFYPVMKLGFLPQPSDPARLAAIAGPATAKRIVMAGEKLDAEAALQTGLIDKISAPEDLLRCANEWATDAANADATHVAAIKRLIYAPLQDKG